MRRSINPTTRRQLRTILVQFYPDESSIRRVVDDAGVNLSRISLNNGVENDWHRILKEAELVNRLDELLAVVEEDYSTNSEWQHIYIGYRQATNQTSHETLASNIKRKDEQSSNSRHTVENNKSDQSNAEVLEQGKLSIEQAIRSHPDFTALFQQDEFLPKEERNGRELLVARPKVAVNVELPLTIEGATCHITFSDKLLRNLNIELSHKEIPRDFIIGRNTPIEWNARRFLNTLEDGQIELTIGGVNVLLNHDEAIDLCYCVDKISDIYIETILDNEHALGAWNGWVMSVEPYSNRYGYEILFLSTDAWMSMFEYASENSQTSCLGYNFYTSDLSIMVETGLITHAEISPKSHIESGGLYGNYVTLLYVPPMYEEDWQNDIGPKGIWTADFTKRWIQETFLPAVGSHEVSNRVPETVSPMAFQNANTLREFSYHIDVIKSWVCSCFYRKIPSRLFVEYCDAFNQLVNSCTIDSRSQQWGYVLKHTASLTDMNSVQNRCSADDQEEFRSILNNNLRYLQSSESIVGRGLDYMLRGHYVFLRDFNIRPSQTAINGYKKALWPLFQRASVEYRFIHLD